MLRHGWILEPINTEVSALMLGFLSTTSNSFTSLVGCTFLLLSLSLCLRSLFYCLLAERPCVAKANNQNIARVENRP
jgi:hypothetical protein